MCHINKFDIALQRLATGTWNITLRGKWSELVREVRGIGRIFRLTLMKGLSCGTSPIDRSWPLFTLQLLLQSRCVDIHCPPARVCTLGFTLVDGCGLPLPVGGGQVLTVICAFCWSVWSWRSCLGLHCSDGRLHSCGQRQRPGGETGRNADPSDLNQVRFSYWTSVLITDCP